MVTGIPPYTTARKGEIWEGTNLELISVKPVRFAKIRIVQYLVGIEFQSKETS